VESGGVKLASSSVDLLDYIRAYLDDPSIDAEGRKRIVREQCQFTDGNSSGRVVDFIIEYMNSGK